MVKWIVLVVICASCQGNDPAARVSYPDDTTNEYLERNRQQQESQQKNKNRPVQPQEYQR